MNLICFQRRIYHADKMQIKKEKQQMYAPI